MSVIILTTGQPGAGKSYSRVRWLISDFLIHNDGLYITNLPLNVEEISSDLSSSTGKDYDYYLNRIIVIPDEELKAWRELALLDKNLLKEIKDDCGFRPAEFFDNYELQGAHIAIDEFHRYCSKSDPILLRKVWNDWFAEVRKLGCTFEAITQDISQLPRDFYGKVGVKIDLAPFGDTLDPFFKIKMFDWYQLKGGFTGDLVTTVEQIESIKDVSNSGSVSWKEIKHDRFKIDGRYFKYYNSFQKSDNSDKVQNFQSPASIYRWKIIFWFLRRNFLKLFIRLLVVFGFIWLTFGGGLTYVIQGFLSGSSVVSKANQTEIQIQEIKKTDNVSILKNHYLQNSSKTHENSSFVDSAVIDYSCYIPVFFYDNQVTLTNGDTINEFSFIQRGPLKGKQIQKIDFKQRFFIVNSVVFSLYDKRDKESTPVRGIIQK